jgi:hypothetical protein
MRIKALFFDDENMDWVANVLAGELRAFSDPEELAKEEHLLNYLLVKKSRGR